MKISAIVKCQILDESLLQMTQEAVDTIQPYIDQLILVDQGSTVGMEWMNRPGITYIRNDISKGFPDTVKQGMEVSEGDYVAVLNNDIKFQGDWINPLVELIKETNVGLVHPKMLNWNDPYITGDEVIYNPPPQEGMYFSAFLLDPVIYKKLGGWDTDYDFWGYDDWDYYYRLLTGNYNAIWTNKVCYWHKGGATISKIGREQFIVKNRRIFTEKHGIDPHHIDWKFL